MRDKIESGVIGRSGGFHKVRKESDYEDSLHVCLTSDVRKLEADYEKLEDRYCRVIEECIEKNEENEAMKCCGNCKKMYYVGISDIQSCHQSEICKYFYSWSVRDEWETRGKS